MDKFYVDTIVKEDKAVNLRAYGLNCSETYACDGKVKMRFIAESKKEYENQKEILKRNDCKIIWCLKSSTLYM